MFKRENTIHLCAESNLPALMNMCVLMGQCAFFGMFEMRLTPADQCKSPPNESATVGRSFRFNKVIYRDLEPTSVSGAHAICSE